MGISVYYLIIINPYWQFNRLEIEIWGVTKNQTFRGIKLINKLKHQTFFQIFIYGLLVNYLFLVGHVQAEPDKSYFRIEQSKPSDENDLTLSAISGLIFEDNMQAHLDLSYLESDFNGKGATLDFGGGYVFNWNVSLFIGIGIALGYNWDNEDLIATYYPEAGIVIDLSNNYGLTISAKRIYNLYDQEFDVIMLGIVFR